MLNIIILVDEFNLIYLVLAEFSMSSIQHVLNCRESINGTFASFIVNSI
jgi:hypothetical protein